MARRKNQPETVQAKCHLAERLREIRTELYGERGGSEMARQLGVPIRTWYNYESGVTVPAEVLLKFMELTSVEPLWLLNGRGARFRTPPVEVSPDTGHTVRSLLRTALQHLEHLNGSRPATAPLENGSAGWTRDDAAPRSEDPLAASVPGKPERPAETPEAWIAAEREGRFMVVPDDAMAPIVGMGAHAAYAAEPEPVEDLEGAMVIAWLDGQPLLRWFRLSGTYGMLHAENPDYTPSIALLDLTLNKPENVLRRVLWIGTPH